MYKMIRIPMRRRENEIRTLQIIFGSFDVAKKTYSGNIFEVRIDTDLEKMDELTGAVGFIKSLCAIKSKSAERRLNVHLDFCFRKMINELAIDNSLKNWLKDIPEPELDVSPIRPIVDDYFDSFDDFDEFEEFSEACHWQRTGYCSYCNNCLREEW